MSQHDTDEDLNKWTCSYCTYLNFLNSRKCTICRNLRRIEPSPDIYKLAEECQRHNGRSNSGLCESVKELSDFNDRETNASSTFKWRCTSCTYLNWPRSQKCIQCGVQRPKNFSNNESLLLPVGVARENQTNIDIEQNFVNNTPNCVIKDVIAIAISEEKVATEIFSQNLNASDDGIDNKDVKFSSVKIAQTVNQTTQTSDPQSPSSPVEISVDAGDAADAVVSILDSQIIAKKLQKWTCNACTYENWPKAIKCAMCAINRIANTQESMSSVADETKFKSHEVNTSINGNGASGKRSNNGSKQNSPKSDLPTISDDVIHTLGAHASIFEDERSVRARLREIDWLFLQACRAVAYGDTSDQVDAYLAAGGEPTRPLSNSEVQILKKLYKSSVDVGHTLIHLSIRHHREDLLTILLSCSEQVAHGGPRMVKKVPCHVCPDVASSIRRQIALSLRQRKGHLMSCYFFTDLTTFALSNKIYDLPPSVLERLFDEIIDRDVQKELEEENSVINWSMELVDNLGSRLFALWNRTAGDCLLDSVLQATWGVFDSENNLRQALAESLNDAANVFYPRWKEYESVLASALQFQLDEYQWARDWDLILQMASKPGAALEQAHIFALAHIIRRPIIVYGVRDVKSFRGETIGYARFEGFYIPMLWEPSFCWRSPICLGYTRGHFTALVPLEPDNSGNDSIAPTGCANNVGVSQGNSNNMRCVFLPMTDVDGKILPVHFVAASELGREQAILRSWLDCCLTRRGQLVCRMRLHRSPPLVQEMLDDWLDHYHHQIGATGGSG